jgi:hypothetical protein
MEQPAPSPAWRRVVLAMAACLASPSAWAQQLEPRAFAPNPTGASLVSLTAGRMDGDVLLDPAAPIEDFEAEVVTVTAGYARTFAIGDRFASFGMAVPYASLDATGRVNGEFREVARDGFGDLVVRFTVSLLPGSAMDVRTFTAQPPRGTFGLSMVVAAPVGQYSSERLVNLGTNRWAAKTELGGAFRLRVWSLEGSVGGWFFEDNDDFFGGSRKSQDPIGVVQAHFIRSFPGGAWLGFGVTGYEGGRTEVDGVRADDRQKNTRSGVALSLPLDRQQSLKLTYSTGTTTRAGGDFDRVSLSWQYTWLH